jgi:hypothetical protein
MSVIADLGPEALARVQAGYLREINSSQVVRADQASSGDVIAQARAANPFRKATRSLLLQTHLWRLAPDEFARLKAEAEQYPNG